MQFDLLCDAVVGSFPFQNMQVEVVLLLAALRGQIADPTPLLQSSDWRNRGFSVGNIMMLLCGRHQSWVGINIRLS
jgi:hypothetical protein